MFEPGYQAVSMAIVSSLIDNRMHASSDATQAVSQALTRYPAYVLQYLANAGVRVVPLGRNVRYDTASTELKRLGVDVDAWPAPPAGLFVCSERTVYLRSFCDMTVCHELGHACDLVLGGGVYRSSTDPKLRSLFDDAKAYVTPYAASAKDEYFAESVRAMVEANEPQSFWPRVTRTRLKRIDAGMYAYIEELFEEMRAAVEDAPKAALPPKSRRRAAPRRRQEAA